MIGVAIGRYVIRKKLAEGGMGAVYLAEHESLATKKVVKLLLAEYSRNEVIRQRFEREATAASRLKHRNIVTIDDFGVLPDGQMFLVMPFLDGRPLDAHIRQNGTLTLHHTFHIIVQLCRALQHLHDHGIVHRDLKPGNAFIVATDDNPYEVILIDLGIARDIANEAGSFKTQTGMAMGTPGYMAVEQFGNAANATPAADLYAVAIIVWEMLTGHLPWGVHDTHVLYHLQMTRRPEPPPGHAIPADVLSLLLQTLSPDPAFRPQSARAFAVALAATVPSIPPHVPSGAEIMLRFAKEFVHNVGPNLETVRNSASSAPAMAVAPMAWPYRNTAVPNPPSDADISSPGYLQTPAQPQTVQARPAGGPGAPNTPPTTLSASSGVAVPHAPTPTAKRGRSAGLLIGGSAFAAVLAFGIVKFRGGSESEGKLERTESTNAAASQPAPALTNNASTFDALTIDAGVAQPADAATIDSAPTQEAAVPVDAALDARAPKGNDRRKAPPGPPKRSDRGSAAPGGFDPDAVEE